MPVSVATYKRVALEDPEGQRELVCGRLRSKPPMIAEHNEVMDALDEQLRSQLSRKDYAIRINSGRLRISTGTYYVPDVTVIPRAFVKLQLRHAPSDLEVYEQPMPLVVEVWSRSTGEYDVRDKLLEYQWRGDLEIWRIHPYAKTLTAWRRKPDGSYEETLHRTGTVTLVALPAVAIEVESLFE
ncbi:MAG: Uma2 family endonuclease [Dehalococcoidia bacterium]